MKQAALIILYMTITFSVVAQTDYGIASFSTPIGWQSVQQAASLELQPKRSNGNICRITISASIRMSINTADAYLQYRSGNNSEGYKYSESRKAITRSEANGIVNFFSYGTGISGDSKVWSYFYSFTNGQQSFFVHLVTDDNSCVGTFNSFLSSLQVEEASTGAKAKRRKAAPAAPAAPAPMM